jgi:DNA-binding NtrC family response regulator
MNAFDPDVQLAERVELNVLIVGETTADAADVAEFVHKHSRRRHAALVTVCCAQLSETQLEPEVRAGAERAHGGTLLLENVDELAEAAQSVLLRLLQTEITTPGDHQSGVRLMSTTTQPLFDRVLAGTFLEQLYYVLNTIYIASHPSATDKFVLTANVEGAENPGWAERR